MLGQRRHQSPLIESGGTQLVQQRLHLGLSLAAMFSSLQQSGPGGVNIGLEQIEPGSSHQIHPEQMLFDAIVQFPGQPMALLQTGQSLGLLGQLSVALSQFTELGRISLQLFGHCIKLPGQLPDFIAGRVLYPALDSLLRKYHFHFSEIEGPGVVTQELVRNKPVLNEAKSPVAA